MTHTVAHTHTQPPPKVYIPIFPFEQGNPKETNRVYGEGLHRMERRIRSDGSICYGRNGKAGGLWSYFSTTTPTHPFFSFFPPSLPCSVRANSGPFCFIRRTVGGCSFIPRAKFKIGVS